MHTWNGIFLPAGTPSNIVNFINQALIDMLKEPEVVAKLTAMGFEPKGLRSEEFSALVVADLKKWQKIITDAGIPIQAFQ
jgi:tripartite-type tricarboxylate transporter receptor subunit TctC